jgi:hypothetical protein
MSNKELAQENEDLKEIILNVVESLQAVLEYLNDNIEIVDEEDEE